MGRIYDNSGTLQDVTIISKLPAYASLGTGEGAANIYARFDSRQQLIDYGPNYSGWKSTNPTMWDIDSDGIIIPTAMVGKVYKGSKKVTVSICDFSGGKYDVTLPFSVTTSFSCSSIGWGIAKSISATGKTFSLTNQSDWNGRIGNQILSVADGTTIRWVECIAATLVIKTRADLDRFPTVAKAQCSEKYLFGGTFMLANDIQYGNGSYTWESAGGYRGFPMFAYYQKVVDEGWVAASGAKAWNDTRYMGFKGVFNGNGYNIDGLFIGTKYGGVAGGFIGLLHKDGVIKNLSFTHAYVSDGVGFLTCGCGGTITDVYVHLDRQCGGDSYNRCSVVASQTYAANVGTAESPVYQYSLLVDRVMFVIDHKTGNADLYSTPIGEFYDYARSSRGADEAYDYIQHCGGYGNYNAQYNAGTTYDNSGIRYLGSGNAPSGKGHWVHCAARSAKATFYSSDAWVVTGCTTGNPGFWRTTASGDLTTRNLNGSDL